MCPSFSLAMCFGRQSTPTLQKVGRFNEICSDLELYSSFEDFLKQDYAEENLWFYRDVIKFRNSVFESEEDMNNDAEEIATNYLGLGTGEPVINVHPDQTKLIIKNLKKKKVSLDMFDFITSDIQHLLETKYVQFESANRGTS
eukprot:TRINITY_DN7050_c0_g1_i1.p1 TRINITY_DN7050_c0_g1~~TRINITY_DN7050_c0_g1_i1.p1  ORF type:complete len:143 (+),score=23.86 TRINITY_DN7050_c0_g1_i1:102-530(+)